ncbi:hypothetical protein [Streptomyces olivaceus]|nr:hypothetical protein [Streptomyces olivaceus]GHI97984.1 hypothetical protein TPA0905_74550 [Streptomyces olivaceus]
MPAGAACLHALLSGGWFAAVMLTHAFAFDERRMQAYVEDHARALALAGR